MWIHRLPPRDQTKRPGDRKLKHFSQFFTWKGSVFKYSPDFSFCYFVSVRICMQVKWNAALSTKHAQISNLKRKYIFIQWQYLGQVNSPEHSLVRLAMATCESHVHDINLPVCRMANGHPLISLLAFKCSLCIWLMSTWYACLLSAA